MPVENSQLLDPHPLSFHLAVNRDNPLVGALHCKFVTSFESTNDKLFEENFEHK